MTGLLVGAVLAAAFTSAFERPDALHSTGFFWFWYDKLSSEKVAEQQEDLHAHGGDSLCVHPFPKSFRPGVQPSDMEPDYLTDGYFRLYGEVLDRAEKLGQTAWLYDEGGWPSGGACGRVYASDPERFGQRYMGPGCRVVRPDVDPSVSAPYPSVLELGVTEKFLELTHEEYYRRFARHFGKTIRYAFTDEPGFGRKNREEWLPWCSDFENEFEARKHYSVKPYLEQLLTMTNANEKVARVRVDYHDVLSQLFIERYARPVRTWCRSHGIGSGGHYGGEDEFSGNRRHGFGHILRALREMDAPGVDVIWRQLWPGDHRTRTPFAKYASSAAHQTGARDVMAEVFAIYGDGMTALQMKWVVDYLLVRGCNMFVLGYYQPCPPGPFMGGGGMHFGPSEPRWDDMSDFFSYMNRHSAVLSQGEPVRKVAVFYDVRASWAGGEDCDRAEAAHLDVSRNLLERHCDFDYVDDDQLAAAEIVSGPRPALRIGKATYESVVLPSSKWMQPSARSRLEEFRARGGVVAEDENGLERIPALCRVRGEYADDIRVAKRMADGQAIYFFTNESMQPAEVEIQLDENGSLSAADHRQGAFVPLASQGGTFHWSAPGAGSLLVLVGEKANGSTRSVKFDGEILLDGEWEMAVRERVRPGLEKMEIERFENPVFAFGRLGDWRGQLGGEFSGKVVYRKRFSSPEDGRAELDLGAVCGSAAVRVNDSESVRLFLPPYRCPVSVRKGENVIEIEVANALVNAVFSPAFRKRLERQFPPRGKYEDYAEVFNREGHESGLQGPVRLVRVDDSGLVGPRKKDASRVWLDLTGEIRRVAASGGGRVTVPAGRWLTGGIRLASNVELHFENGADLMFTDDLEDYLPPVPTSWEGVECLNVAPLIHADGATNVAITGKGVLSPIMLRWERWRAPTENQAAAKRTLNEWGEKDVPLRERDVTKLKEANLRPQFIGLRKCCDVRLEGFSVRNSPFWVIHLLDSDRVRVRNLDVEAFLNNNDGIDIESCRDVVVEDCRFNVDDDVIVCKSGRDRDGRRRATPTEDVVVRRVTAVCGHALLGIGSELSGGVRRVRMEDCTVEGACSTLLNIKTTPTRGGYVDDVTMRRVWGRRIDLAMLNVTTGYVDGSTPFDATKDDVPPTCIGGIVFEGVLADHAARRLNLNGDVREPIRRFFVRDVMASHIDSPDCVKNVELAQ